jgi:hypothetical protein
MSQIKAGLDTAHLAPEAAPKERIHWYVAEHAYSTVSLFVSVM